MVTAELSLASDLVGKIDVPKLSRFDLALESRRTEWSTIANNGDRMHYKEDLSSVPPLLLGLR